MILATLFVDQNQNVISLTPLNWREGGRDGGRGGSHFTFCGPAYDHNFVFLFNKSTCELCSCTGFTNF